MNNTMINLREIIICKLEGTSKKKARACCELAIEIAFEKGFTTCKYLSYTFLPNGFKNDFENTVNELLKECLIYYVSNGGPQPWSGWLYKR